MNYTVLGVFENHMDVDKALRELDNRGYQGKDISIVMKDDGKGKITPGKGAARGAATGAIVGGLAGLVAGMVIPGLGAFFIGGPIAEALGLAGVAAAGATGAATGVVGGGILGALTGWGVSRQDAMEYERRIQEGDILVAVPARPNEERDVESILEKYNADSIRSVAMPEERYQERPERYTEPSQAAYMGAKGGQAEKSGSTGASSSGKGWHGDPEGHAKAGRGEDVPGRGKGK